MNRRGMFFTLMAISLLSLLFVSYSVYSFVNDRSNIDSRVNSMNRYVFSLEEDLSRKVYISSFRILFIYEKRIAETGEYVSDVDETFSEAFFNGTMNGNVDEAETSLLNGVLFEDILNSINEDSSQINLEVNFTNPIISVSQTDPWTVKINLSGNLYVRDLSGLASWNKTSDIISYVSIEKFEDPIYIVNTNGLVPRKFNQTVYSGFVDGENVSNLTLHLENYFYTSSNLSPSFLNRLEGNFSASPQGIESLVYLPDLASQGISLRDKSIVDYIYFSGENPVVRGVSGMPSWFKIDLAHQDIYEVNEILN